MPKALRRLQVRISHVTMRALDEGSVWTLWQIAARFVRLLLWLLTLPLAIILHLAGVRRLPVITQRIGHLAAEFDCFLKDHALGHLPNRRWFVAAPRKKIANSHLLQYWRPHIPVISNPALATFLQIACRPPVAAHDISEFILTQHGPAHYGAVNALWPPRAPLLRLSDEDMEWGRSMIRELGIPSESWFVCVHPRSAGFAVHDDRVHEYRNSSPSNLDLAIEAIASRGGWCVQMGDPAAPKLAPRANFIDYAHHRLRSARFDVVLCALCRFFLGSSSGLYLVSSVFGVPCALANVAPMTALPYSHRDLFIPKLYRSASTGRLLTFPEVLASESADFRHSRLFRSAGLDLAENTPDEIVDLVQDMFDQLDQPSHTQKQSRDAFTRLLRPHHYGYASSARISRRFLARHPELLSS